MDSRFDPTVPQSARVRNFLLGGKDHYAADRKVGEEVMELRPQIAAGVRANRDFLARVVRHLAGECGIRQFLDIGPGLPAGGSVHEVAQAIAPRCRIVYADNDPVVLAHARALLTSSAEGSCAYLDADLRDTAAILAGAAKTLDFSRPVAVLLLSVLALLPDGDDPPGIVAALAGALAPGSYAAISHVTADFAAGPVAAAVDAYNAAARVPVTTRTHAGVTALFGGLSLVAPGVVPVTAWRPGIRDGPLQPADLYAGLARARQHRTTARAGPR
jgi:S-adenosyl methyltransferase